MKFAIAAIFLSVAFSLQSNKPKDEGKIYLPKGSVIYRFSGNLEKLAPIGDVYYTNSEVVFPSGFTASWPKRKEIDSLFPDSTCTACRTIKNDSWVKTALYIAVSKNRWSYQQIETLISGNCSSYFTHKDNTSWRSYSFNRFDGPKVGFLHIKGTNIYVITPHNQGA